MGAGKRIVLLVPAKKSTAEVQPSSPQRSSSIQLPGLRWERRTRKEALQILCCWCHTWFPYTGPDGFFPHLIEAHPQSVQARTVAAATGTYLDEAEELLEEADDRELKRKTDLLERDSIPERRSSPRL